MSDEQPHYWSYRLVDFGDDATGNHRGIAICEVHFEATAPKSHSSPVHVESFRDYFGDGATAEHCRQAIITALERMLDAARSFPVLLASEIAA